MTRSESPNGDGPAAVDDVGLLIANAGQRPAPGASVDEAVRSAVERAWSAEARRRNRRRVRRQLLTAALGAVAIGLSWVALRPDMVASSVVVGTLVGARGPVHFAPVVGSGLIVNGDPLSAGTSVETGTAGMALLTIAGVAVRVGPATVLELERPDEVRLARGQVYLDSGPSGAHAVRLWVTTAFGRLAHVGTQFQVRVDPGHSMSVSVREGRVRLDAPGHAQTIARGDRLDIAPGGSVTHGTVETYDASWAWASALVPDFPIEGRPLSAFLDWFVRETGRTVVFVPPTTRADTDQTTLNGSISGLTPQQALDAVLATTRFRYDVTVPGQLRIDLRATVSDGLRANAIPATPSPVP